MPVPAAAVCFPVARNFAYNTTFSPTYYIKVLNAKIIALFRVFLRNVTHVFLYRHEVYNISMTSYEELYLDRRPQNLCHMCGRCCRVVTTTRPYQELQKMAQAGDEGAVDFLKIFEPYPSIDAAKEADAEVVENVIKRTCEERNLNPSRLTFYKCKYLLDDNKCSIYEERPALCRHCPSTPWAVVPPGCGFEAWLFLKREEVKQKIRKSKEDLLELKLLRTKMKNPEDLKKIDAVVHKIYGMIESYKKYGAEDW